MNVVLFRPIDGDPNILVATLSGHDVSAAAIVTRTPSTPPSWPESWSYQIAGDLSRPPSDPFSNEQAAVEAAAHRLCDALYVDRLDWIIDRPDEEDVPLWCEGAPMHRAAGEPIAAGEVRYQFEEPVGRARAAGEAVADAIRDGLLTPPRPNPTGVTEARPSLLSRLRGVWKAWRL